MAPAGERRVQRWVDSNLVNSRNLVYIVLFSMLIVRLRLLLQLDRVRPDPPRPTRSTQGGFIPGVRPGPQTERYLRRPVNRSRCRVRCSSPVIAITPYIILWLFDVQNFPFAGTTVLIAVGVALELMRQIDSQLMLRNYEGFLK
jgi:preprotein translocase subunit SecY